LAAASAPVVRALNVVAPKIDFPAGDIKFTTSRRKNTSEDFYNGRFTGTVISDQPDDFVATDLQVDARQSAYQTKILINVDHPQRVLVGGILKRITHRKGEAPVYYRFAKKHDN
jgi:hypothetical protein